MKHFTLFFVFLSSLFSVTAQKLNWIKRQGGTTNDQTNAVAADRQGNVIAIGTFDGTASFGNFNLTSNGSLDIFVAKYDSNGTCLWAKKAGGSFGDEGTHVAVDNNNNIYITGVYGQAGASFEGTFVGTLGGLRNGFIARYRPDGSLVWVKTIGGVNAGASPSCLAVSPDGNIYLTGAFYGNTTFNGTSTITSTAGGSNDVFLAQYDTAGVLGWVKKGGDRKDESVTGLTVDNLGNPVIYGTYDSLTTFMSTTKYAQYLGDFFGHHDLFLVKYSSAGNELWFESFGGGDDDESGGLCVDETNNLYTSGFFRNNFIASNGVNQNNPGSTNTLFLFKLKPAGTPYWIKYSVASFTENSGYQKGVALYYHNRNIYTAGYFGNKFKFGSTVFSGGGDRNPMLLKYDSSGTAIWGTIGKSTAINVSQGLSVTAFNENVYYSGFLKGTVTFGDSAVTAPSVYNDGFIVSVNDKTPVVSSVPAPTLLYTDSVSSVAVNLHWAGASPEFRVLMKIGSSSVDKDDGTVVYEGPNTTVNVNALLAAKPYFFTVYGKAAGVGDYSAGNKKLGAATLPVAVTDGYVVSVLANDTFSRQLPAASLSFGMQSASSTDGWIKAEVLYNLTSTGTLPSGIDSIFTNQYWILSNNGLTGASLRFCVKILLTALLGPSADTSQYTLLRRRDAQDNWENIQTNPAYAVSYDLPQSIKVCNLSALGEFVIAKKSTTTGIAETTTGSFHYYPNPSAHSIRVDTKIPFTQDIELYALNGSKILTEQAAGKSTVNINHNGLAPGIYLLKIEGSYFKHVVIN